MSLMCSYKILRKAFMPCLLTAIFPLSAHAASVDAVLGDAPTPGVERVVILEESFPDVSATPDKSGEKRPPLSVVPSKPEARPAMSSVPKTSPKPGPVKPAPETVKVEKPVAEKPVAEKPVAEKKEESKAQSEQPARPSDYEVMSDMQRALLVLQLRQKLMSVQVGIDKSAAEQSKIQKELVADDLMNFRLGPPGKGMALPVIPSSQVPEARPAPRAENTEPPLRVVGIQGYDGVFSAQILNNGGLVSVEAGTEIEGGVHILSINESGVKVRKTVEKDGQTKEEILTLPFSR